VIITITSSLNSAVKLMQAVLTVCKCFHTFLPTDCI